MRPAERDRLKHPRNKASETPLTAGQRRLEAVWSAWNSRLPILEIIRRGIIPPEIAAPALESFLDEINGLRKRTFGAQPTIPDEDRRVAEIIAALTTAGCPGPQLARLKARIIRPCEAESTADSGNAVPIADDEAITLTRELIERFMFGLADEAKLDVNETYMAKPSLKLGLALLSRICNDLGRSEFSRRDLEAHPGYWRPLGKSLEVKQSPGARFLEAVFDATGEPHLSDAILRAHKLDVRQWRRDMYGTETLTWGDESEGYVEHALHELKRAGWRIGQPVPHGPKSDVFCLVAARCKIRAASFSAAVKRVQNAFNEAMARGFKPAPFRHTAVIGKMTIEVGAGRRLLDPETLSVMPPGEPHIVPNSTHWRRAIHCGDAVLVG